MFRTRARDALLGRHKWLASEKMCSQMSIETSCSLWFGRRFCELADEGAFGVWQQLHRLPFARQREYIPQSHEVPSFDCVEPTQGVCLLIVSLTCAQAACEWCSPDDVARPSRFELPFEAKSEFVAQEVIDVSAHDFDFGTPW